jgi:hypothetical protein
MLFHAFEMCSETSFFSYVDLDRLVFDEKLRETLERPNVDPDTLLIGTVIAADIEEAIEKIRAGKWDYTQRC